MTTTALSTPGSPTGPARNSQGHSAHDELAAGAVVTPEGVVLEFQLAGVASRALAASIDAIIQIVVLIVAVIVGAAVGAASDILGLIFILFSVIIVAFGYPVAMELLNGGRSVGRMAMGTRVVTTEGAPVGFRHSMIRAFLSIVDHFLTFGGFAMVSALLTRRGQRLGDLAAGTMVVRERAAGPKAQRVWYRAAVNPVTINAAGVSEELYNEIRLFLLRESDMSPWARDSLGKRLEALVTTATGMIAPAGIGQVAWLSSVAAAASGQVGAAPAPGAPVTVIGWSASSAISGQAPPPPVAGTGVSARPVGVKPPPPPLPR